MKNKDKKMMLFVIATIVTSLGIGYTLLRGTRAVSETPANEAFDDILFYQCVVDAYNKENNTDIDYSASLTDEQLASVEKLSCFAKTNIVSAKGIEKMTSLTSLDMRYNKLSSIDLSNNTLLTTFRASDNDLTSLDLSNNINLTSLDVSDNNISEINLGNVSSLLNIDISGNDVSSLNVSNNILLKTLDASKNALTSLEVSANTAMTSLNLAGNQLTDLNVENNVELTTLIVGADNSASGGPYDGNGNVLETLNVSKNTKLQKLAASNNKLTKIDVSQNTELTELSLYNNQLTEINVDSNTKLKILNLGFAYGCYNTFSGLACGRSYGNNISSINLTYNTDLEDLYISNNQLKNIDLSNNKKLVYVQLSNNQLESLNVSGYESLAYLTADENNLSSLNVSGSFNLSKLFVYENNLTELNVNGLNKLNYLIAFDNKIESIDLSDNTLLTYIDLEDNLLTDLDLSKNDSLTMLYLSNNKLEKLNVSNNLNLKRIYVDNNQLSSLDISKNESLQYLNIDDNPYSETLYVYKDDVVNVGNNVKIPTHLNWDAVTWNTSDANVASLVGVNSVKGVVAGNTSIIGTVKDKYTTTSNIKVIDVDSDIYKINFEKKYIYIIDGVFDIENIKVTNATSKVENNILYITDGDKIIDKFDIVSFNSELYEFNDDYVYSANSKFDINNIDFVSLTGNVENNKLIIKYKDESLAEYDIVNFNIKEYSVTKKRIYIETELDYSVFMANITSDNNAVSFKVYNSDTLVEEGNVVHAMILKILYNDNVIDEYKISNEYVKFNEELEVNSDKYIVQDIAFGSSVSDLTELVDSNGNVSVYDKDGNIIADTTSKLKTGDKLVVKFEEYDVSYTISVTGDITGDGNIDISDIERVSEHILEHKVISGDEYLLASDYDDNGTIDINDIIKIADYVVNNG